MPPICYVHAGTHKSGTTYLQNFLQSNEYALAGEGLYVPLAGRVNPSGHHNIAWELNGDKRYDPTRGTISDLLAELCSVRASRACISSEDFEYLYANPKALTLLRSKLNEIGYAVKVLFYLRPQAEYAESLYAEFVRHGFTLDFPEFLELFAAGKLKGYPTSDYSILLNPFADVFGADNMIVRRFWNSGDANRILIDFLSRMLPDFKCEKGKYRVNSFKENVSIPFSQVFQLFVRNNLATTPTIIPIDVVELAKSIHPHARSYQYLSGPFDAVDLKDVLTKFWKLRLSNLRVLLRYRVFIPVLSGRALGRDVWAWLGFNSSGRRRKSLIRAFRRGSDRLALLMTQHVGGTSKEEDRFARENARVGVAPQIDARLAGGPDDLVAELRRQVIDRDEQIGRLNSELSQREAELRQLRIRASKHSGERHREMRPLDGGRIGPRVSRPTSKRILDALGRSTAAGYMGASRLAGSFRKWKFARVIAGSGLFDREFYWRQKPGLKETGIDPIDDFLVHGNEEGFDPHPLFDASYYLEQNPDVVRTGVNPLFHFITHGSEEGRDPHPLFDTSYYLEQNPDVARAGEIALVHFLKCGASEGRNPCPLFDVSYYLQQNPDVAKLGVNPLVQFIQSGAGAGLSPHPLFDTSYYLAENPDVGTAGLNPLTHFIRYGAIEGRNPHPLFDVSYYRKQIADTGGRGFNSLIHFIATFNPLIHFLQYGVHERRNPHPLFDTSFYLEKNPDVARAGLNPLIHFIHQGAYEGRDPSASFSMTRYLQEKPEVADSDLNPLIHFVLQAKKKRVRSGS